MASGTRGQQQQRGDTRQPLAAPGNIIKTVCRLDGNYEDADNARESLMTRCQYDAWDTGRPVKKPQIFVSILSCLLAFS